MRSFRPKAGVIEMRRRCAPVCWLVPVQPRGAGRAACQAFPIRRCCAWCPNAAARQSSSVPPIDGFPRSREIHLTRRHQGSTASKENRAAGGIQGAGPSLCDTLQLARATPFLRRIAPNVPVVQQLVAKSVPVCASSNAPLAARPERKWSCPCESLAKAARRAFSTGQCLGAQHVPSRRINRPDRWPQINVRLPADHRPAINGSPCPRQQNRAIARCGAARCGQE